MMNIMNPPADWSTLKKLIWLRGTPINGGEELTVTGTPPLSLPNSLGKPLKAWSVDVLPKQDLNGYDSPWPAGGGTNLFNEATGAYGNWVNSDGTVVSGIYGYISDKIPIASGGTYCLKYYGVKPYSAGIIEYAADNSFVKRTLNIEAIVTATLDPLTAYIKIEASTPEGTQSSMTQEKLISCKIMVTKNSYASTYSPYSNICPILGTDKLNMFVEESYDQSATPKAVLTLPQTVYTGTIGSEGGESRSIKVDMSMLNWQVRTTGSVNVEYSAALPQNYFCSDSQSVMVNKWLTEEINYVSPINHSVLQNHVDDYQTGVYSFNSNTNRDVIYALLPIGTSPTTLGNLVYEVSQPTEFAVTAPDIPTPTGTATTWATAEDGTVESMEVTYVGKA